MTKSHLRACPACSRHVRVSEESCPFCGGGIPQALRDSPAPQPPRMRLTRAAIFALGAGTLAATPACGGSTTNPGQTVDSGTDGASAVDSGLDFDAQGAALYGLPAFDSGGSVPAYGGTGIEDSGAGDVDGGFDAQGAALYGAPILEDSGEANDADQAFDVGGGAAYGGGPVYGGPGM